MKFVKSRLTTIVTNTNAHIYAREQILTIRMIVLEE